MTAIRSSSPTATATQMPNRAARPLAGQALSADELYRLTLYKWRYGFEALGFDDGQVATLMFLKWLVASRRLVP